MTMATNISANGNCASFSPKAGFAYQPAVPRYSTPVRKKFDGSVAASIASST